MVAGFNRRIRLSFFLGQDEVQVGFCFTKLVFKCWLQSGVFEGDCLADALLVWTELINLSLSQKSRFHGFFGSFALLILRFEV